VARSISACTAATFFLGEFYAEALIFAETANSIGAIQVASSTEATQTPFFIAACDYVLIGDEFYAASAYLTRQPVLVGSLVGQDWCKLLVLGSILLGTLVNTSYVQSRTTKSWDDEKAEYGDVSERQNSAKQSIVQQLATPLLPKMPVERPLDPNAPVEDK
jgi:hypothetical protein